MRNASRRFWPCIAAALAVSVIAVPPAAADVDKYGTQVSITHDRFYLFHGDVNSEVRKCERGRRVFLFRREPGRADPKVGHGRSNRSGGWGFINPNPRRGTGFYVKVTREVRDGDVCLADRSPTDFTCVNQNPFCKTADPLTNAQPGGPLARN